jgi:hypothetical protein
METLAYIVAAGFVAMLLLIPVCLVRGRRLKDHVRRHHPDVFAQIYGEGTFLGKSARNDISRIRFVHGSVGPDDRPLSKLRESLRTVERLYLLLFVVTVVSFIALAVPK